MNLFDQLVTAALTTQPTLASLRVVVEKEILHHDILRILSQENLLSSLTFIGGTCLRACYGGIRLSEDLDFTGGKDFSRTHLANMGHILVDNLNEKYSLRVAVSEPIKENKNVDTWKIKIETRPTQKHLPAQRINIDICRVPSYEKQAMLLINPYGIDMGTNGLVIQAQSREEIYTDKLLAFALRPNRLKYRDLWDITWLHQQGIKPNLNFLPKKLGDRNITPNKFLGLFANRHKLLNENTELAKEFNKEMQRFLPTEQLNKISNQNNLWDFIVYLISDFNLQLSKIFEKP
jgi:predicted nucleotidyltransferase component of viral defense system